MKKKKSKRWWWVSFSYKGVHQGACNLRAQNEELALADAIIKEIAPTYDDVLVAEIPDAELEEDKLYGMKDLLSMGYHSVNTHTDRSLN